MNVEVTCDRLHPAQQRLGDPRDDGDRSQDVQALPARETKPEVRTMQLGSAGLQHADERLEGDERVVLILDTRRDVETRQEWLRVSAELPDQVAVSPQVGRTDQAAHSINSLVSGNDKRSSEDVKTHGGTLDDPVSNTSCEYS